MSNNQFNYYFLNPLQVYKLRFELTLFVETLIYYLHLQHHLHFSSTRPALNPIVILTKPTRTTKPTQPPQLTHPPYTDKIKLQYASINMMSPNLSSSHDQLTNNSINKGSAINQFSNRSTKNYIQKVLLFNSLEQA